MCNAIKDGNLTGGMSYITIICFSPLAVSHTEKCLTTRDYANILFLLVCFAIGSLVSTITDCLTWVSSFVALVDICS